MVDTTEEPVVSALEEEWAAISALGADLAPEEWSLPTECPGWTVRDIVSHMVGTERSLLGDAPPPPPPVVAAHVRNPVGASNESWVYERRALPGPVVLAEFADVTGRRMAQMRAWPSDRFGEPGPSPVGTVPYREFMLVRVMDCWVHEQDIRVATGRPLRAEGAAAEIATDRLASAMGFVVGKQAAAPEGSTVRFDITGPVARRFDVRVHEGRAHASPATDAPDAGAGPTVVLVMDVGAFYRLACGRISGDAAVDAGLVELSGAGTLGETVVRSMAFMI